MTKRDFLILMIKLFGLYSGVNALFSALPNNIFFFMQIEVFDASAYAMIALAVFITVGLFVLLINGAGWIVDKLGLAKGFSDERIELGRIDPIAIVQTGTFIVGGFLFVHEVPNLLNKLLYFFKGEIQGLEFDLKAKGSLATSALTVLISWLLLSNFDKVGRFLTRRQRNDSQQGH